MLCKFNLGSIVYYQDRTLGQQPKRVLWVEISGKEPNYLLAQVTKNGNIQRFYRLENKLTSVSPAIEILLDTELPTQAIQLSTTN